MSHAMFVEISLTCWNISYKGPEEPLAFCQKYSNIHTSHRYVLMASGDGADITGILHTVDDVIRL